MKKKGFTLIELLAVIIILGILMLVAIPSVSSYITNSRKSAYANTARMLIKQTSTMVSGGELEFTDSDTTYYVDYRCLGMENGEAQSPYGELTKSYVGVNLDNKGENYKYYWIGVDSSGMGSKEMIKQDKIADNIIVSGITVDDLDIDYGISNSKYVFVDENCNIGEVHTNLRSYSPECNNRIQINLTSNYGAGQSVYVGTLIKLNVTFDGFDTCTINRYAWQMSTDNGQTWTDITEENFSHIYLMDETNFQYYIYPDNAGRTIRYIARNITANE